MRDCPVQIKAANGNRLQIGELSLLELYKIVPHRASKISLFFAVSGYLASKSIRFSLVGSLRKLFQIRVRLFFVTIVPQGEEDKKAVND